MAPASPSLFVAQGSSIPGHSIRIFTGTELNEEPQTDVAFFQEA
jgi:hypothetical protein